MKRRRTALWIGLVLCLLLIGFAALQSRRLAATNRELGALERRKDAGRREIADLEKKIGLADRRSGGKNAKRSAVAAVPKPAGADLKLERHVLIGSRPTLREAWMAMRRASTDFAYARLFQALGLSSAQVERFKTILVNGQESEMDLAVAAASEGISWSDPGLEGLKKAASDQTVDQPMKELLGSDYAAYRVYKDELPGWQLVSQLNGLSSYENSPLNDVQSAALEKLFVTNSSHNGDGSVVANSVNWEAVLPAATTILNPSQYQLLHQLGETNTVSGNLDRALKSILGP